MQDLNSLVIIGRLTRDAELKYTTNGFAILNFSIASNRSVKRNDEWQDEVSFFNCTLFGKRAESLAQYLLKGKQIAIDGSIKQDRWEDNEGHKRSVIKILVDSLQFIGGKKNQTTTAPAQEEPAKEEPVTEENFEDDVLF